MGKKKCCHVMSGWSVVDERGAPVWTEFDARPWSAQDCWDTQDFELFLKHGRVPRRRITVHRRPDWRALEGTGLDDIQ